MKTLLAALALVALVSGATPAITQTRIYNGPNGAATRCPASDSECTIYNAPDRIQDRINQGKRDVQKSDSPLDKVKEVGNLRNFWSLAPLRASIYSSKPDLF